LSSSFDTPLEVLGGISAKVFMRDYWQKKPLLIRQAFLILSALSTVMI